MTSCCQHRLFWITFISVLVIVLVHIFSVFRLAKNLPERRLIQIRWQSLNEQFFGDSYRSPTIRVKPAAKPIVEESESNRMRFKYNYSGHQMVQVFDGGRTNRPIKRRPKLSGFTLVTALLDIGRGAWWEYRRPYDIYMKYLENILRLQVIPCSIAELPLSRYRHRMHAIITGELYGGWWLPQWDSHMRSHPEAKSVDYNIVVNSKPYFLFNASQLNPFRSEQFVWLDAGYGHGNRSIFPSDLVWQPVFPNGKVTVIKLTPKEDDIGRYELDDLYRKDRSVISGGFLAADFEAVQRFYRLFAKEVWRMLERRMIDDDQVRLKSLFGYFD